VRNYPFYSGAPNLFVAVWMVRPNGQSKPRDSPSVFLSSKWDDLDPLPPTDFSFIKMLPICKWSNSVLWLPCNTYHNSSTQMSVNSPESRYLHLNYHPLIALPTIPKANLSECPQSDTRHFPIASVHTRDQGLVPLPQAAEQQSAQSKTGL
jgi:hypothetical protein